MKETIYDIGIDIDNVILDYTGFTQVFLVEKYNILLSRKVLVKKYDTNDLVKNIFPFGKDIRVPNFDTKKEYNSKEWLLYGAYEAVKKANKNFKICFITASKENNVRKNFIKYTFGEIPVFFTKEKFSIPCKIYIDDNAAVLQNLLEIKPKSKIIAVSYPYNANVKCRREENLLKIIQEIVDKGVDNNIL